MAVMASRTASWLEKRLPHLGGLRRRQARQLAYGAALLAVLAVPPVFVNHPIGYLPLCTYVFVLALCWGYLQVVKRGFFVEHGFEERSCVRGSSVSLPILMKNRSRLPIFRAQPKVSVSNPYGELDHEATALSMIGAMDDDFLDTNVHLGHVGTYTAGLQGVVLYDPLMLFSSYVETEGQVSIASTPQQHEAAMVEFSELAFQSSPTPTRTVLSDDVDYAGTRDYEYGDPLKSVHWKLSARTQDLQTRLFEEAVNTKLSVVMDFHSPDYGVEDLMSCNDVIVEMALAAMNLAQLRKVEAKLRFVDRNGMLVSFDLPHEGEMEHFVSSLPRLSANVEQRDALDVLDRELSSSGGSSNVVFCTASLTEELVSRVLELGARRASVAIVLALPRENVRAFYRENRGLISELELSGASCTVLSDPSDLEERGLDG